MTSPAREDRYVEEADKEPVDPRNPFQHDRDRLLYAPEFRRLDAVTQVAASHETQLFHNRLTHTLKVAQLARRIAERFHGAAVDIDPDVAEAAALAHDIGHPPFGHIAEAKLDELMVRPGVPDGFDGVPDGFEGNAQSFRIVNSLSMHSSGRLGLNLTRATLQAICKYPWQRGPADHRHRKCGTYASEQEVFEWSREGLDHDRRAAQTPEAAIMDWADDVAYALHDLEDFYKAGLVPLDRLARDETEQSRYLQRTRSRWQRHHRAVSDGKWRECEAIAESLFSEFPAEREPIHLMRRLVAAKANLFAGVLSVEKGLIVEDTDMRIQLDLLKSLTWTYVIESPGLATQQTGQQRIVETLFTYYAEATRARREVLPLWAQPLADKIDEEGSAKRLACDIVASLTEAQAVATFGRLTGTDPGSILDSLEQ